MSRPTAWVFSLAGLVLVLMGSERVEAQQFVTFDVPESIPGNTLASGINDVDQISGYFADANGWHGYIRDPKGKFTTFDVPCAGGTNLCVRHQ